MQRRTEEIPEQRSQRNTFLWSPIKRRISFTDSRLTEWEWACLRMNRCVATSLWCLLQQSQNKGPHFQVELWWHGALKVFCCCVSYWFQSFLVAWLLAVLVRQVGAVGGGVYDCNRCATLLPKPTICGRDCGRYGSLGDRCPVLPQSWLQH